jgi:hypothetical protein
MFKVDINQIIIKNVSSYLTENLQFKPAAA